MINIPILEVEDFVRRSEHTLLIDVRSPKEYERAHMPGAINIPLFNDEERALVGTLYTHKGKKPAVLKGLDIAGPKMTGFVEAAGKLAGDNKEILLYCWRGGMRSKSMAWLLSTAGYQPFLLHDGYKAYRAYTRAIFSRPKKIRVLGGMTGSGKTAVLLELKAMGQQMIDLEGIANHRGSVFGALGMEAQPRTEHFENLLAQEWLAVDPERILWLEDESRKIGNITLPLAVFEQMKQSPVTMMDMPFDQRVARLVTEYGSFHSDILKTLITQITQRLGHENAGKAKTALDERNIQRSIEIVLRYYDKAYRLQLAKRQRETVEWTDYAGLTAKDVAEKLIRDL
ncbi:MAG: tRNA 2-selenouridine(34) synthase MnmH [Bacteroidota bacterium]|nr:tRNA 2-selenouridine(34) synthase MnmH [Bacteroidota bacterium]